MKNIIKGNNHATLLAFNLAVFAGVLTSPLWVSYSPAWLAVTLLAYFCMICLGVSVTYHRALTHRAVKFNKGVEMLFATFASLSGTGSPIMWVLTHRQHHRFADKDGDPHPPETVWKTFLGVYPRVSSHGIRDIIRNRYYAFLHRYYFAVVGGAIAATAIISVQLSFFALILPIFISILVSNVLNWYGHTKGLLGYRNYELSDKSHNNPILGFLIFGEGWHNNHHRHPGSAKFGLAKGEFDLSFEVIRLLQRLKLASSVRSATL